MGERDVQYKQALNPLRESKRAPNPIVKGRGRAVTGHTSAGTEDSVISLDVSGGGTYLSLTPFHIGEARLDGWQN